VWAPCCLNIMGPLLLEHYRRGYNANQQGEVPCNGKGP
jgi:hypothetical protein